jgi:thioredoxin reductase
MADRAVVIVGAGITGLSCACALEGDAAVVLVDRVPVAGGVHGWSAPETLDLERRARTGGARLLLGATATVWDARELVVLGQDGVERITAAALVIAAGTRPRGRAELRIAGPRPAGIVAATVACHLAENGLAVGRRPAVLGGGDWARRATRELQEAGAREVTVIAPDGVAGELDEQGATVRVHEGASVVAVRGGPRVQAVELDDGTMVTCDALVLAHGLVPLRNVDGAIEGGHRVVYAQPIGDPATVEGARRAGEAAAAEVRRILEEDT